MYVSWAHNRAVRQPTSRIWFSSGTPASNLAVRAPPQRAEDAARSAVENELIVIANELLALDFVAVPLVVRQWVEERFRVAHADQRALAARYGQSRISRRQVPLVEQHGRFRMGGVGEAALADSERLLGALLHHGNGARHQI